MGRRLSKEVYVEKGKSILVGDTEALGAIIKGKELFYESLQQSSPK